MGAQKVLAAKVVHAAGGRQQRRNVLDHLANVRHAAVVVGRHAHGPPCDQRACAHAHHAQARRAEADGQVEHPRQAQRVKPLAQRGGDALGLELRARVDIRGRKRLVLTMGVHAGKPGVDLVAAGQHHRCARLGACAGDVLRAQHVDAMGQIRVLLAHVDARDRAEVQHGVGPGRKDEAAAGVRVGQVQVAVRGGDDAVAPVQVARHARGDKAARAGDEQGLHDDSLRSVSGYGGAAGARRRRAAAGTRRPRAGPA